MATNGRPTRARPGSGSPTGIKTGGTAPDGAITPEEISRIRASIGSKEQAPSSRDQAVFANWRQASDQLGSPFEVEHIPISKLRAMRRDPMLGFGLSFIKTPHVRAKWYVNAKDGNGPNAQIAAHLDHDLRLIWTSLVLQWMNSLDFGFQALVKRFEFGIPAGTFIETSDTGEQTESAIWSEGGIQPIRWKPFVAVPPESVNPIWQGDGSFNGIDYDPGAGAQPWGLPAAQGEQSKFKIDLYHSLWVTNEKEQNFGSIFGYPRLGYAYRYWWSYWFRWAVADRAFERKADPSVIVMYPEGEFYNEDTGERMSHQEYALLIGERMRSGGVIAMPSDVYEDANGKGTLRQWEIDFTKDAVNFEPFDNSFDYLDVQKLRSLWIPEQAFLEGKGGTSSRNVAAEMGESFVESQAVLSEQFRFQVNRYIVPQWLAANYPEFVQNNGVAEVKITGFADQDVAFTKEIVQLIGQQESGMREILKMIDLRRVLEEAGTPLASFADQQRTEERLAAEAAAANQPPAVTPQAGPGGTVGVVPTATGFSYVQPRPQDTIFLSAHSAEFLSNLPDTPHYQDRQIKRLAKELWDQFSVLLNDEYATALHVIEEDDSEEGQVELANTFKDRATRMIRGWEQSKLWPAVLDKSKDIMQRIMERAAQIELRRGKQTPTKLSQRERDEWIQDHLADAAAKIAETTRTEVRDYIARQIESGITDRKEIARRVRDHFSDFPNWKTDRIVRTEVRDVYNVATLLAAQSAGIEAVQAVDAQNSLDTDQDCKDRDGKLFHVLDALKEDEHPNGTLAWRIPAVNLSIEVQPELEGNRLAQYDKDRNIVVFAQSTTEIQRNEFLKMVVEKL